VFADGSLGARTAALDYPYNDDQENSGIPIYTQEKLDEVIADANAAGFQVAVHAIGDKAVKMALNSLEKTKPSDRKEGPRHRIEHASVLSPELIQRLKESGVIVTVQPRFVISDSWIQQRLGPERARFTYPFHSLIDAGILVVGSSDCPVEPLSPLSGIGAAVNRTGPEALEVQEAVQLYTRNAAYASAEENVKGTLAPGKYADLVVLEKDPFTVQPTEITEIKVLMTIVGGRVVYRSNSFL
jgi:predicted amidohydrolase YtcJ